MSGNAWAFLIFALPAIPPALWLWWHVHRMATMLRRHRINGEIALVFEGLRRAAWHRAFYGTAIAALAVWPSRTFGGIVVASIAVLNSWAAYQALRDRREAERLAELRMAREG